MKQSVKIAAMCGSLRKDSFNKKLLQAIVEEARDQWEMSYVEIGTLPLFNEDLEKEGDPEEVIRFRDKLKEADGVLIITPEYNSGIPGGLKNALDWASRPPRKAVLNGLPAAVAGATPGSGGTGLSQMQLRQILVAMNVNVMSAPKVLVGEVHKKINQETLKLEDERTLTHLQGFIHGFTEFVELYKGKGY
ncbi:NADPH-dependent FMN reductase [Rossellomorea sp. GCM10028870]|uniref:NADPH-dependent FMN reductase n=1 Tax=Rossellomorea sp. GCM10028870 TaxID=3273426 RepID=UPI0036158CAC